MYNRKTFQTKKDSDKIVTISRISSLRETEWVLANCITVCYEKSGQKTKNILRELAQEAFLALVHHIVGRGGQAFADDTGGIAQCEIEEKMDIFGAEFATAPHCFVA